jgi:CubicO group peptidase (beta-lactamase class C family)
MDEGVGMTGLDLNRRALLGGTVALAGLAGAPALARASQRDFPALQTLINSYVGQGRVPGAIAAIVRPGRFRPLYLSSGLLAFESYLPVLPNTLWRIFSMSKPITAMAVMQQVALGRLQLDQPIADIMPEFAQMQVLIDPEKSLKARPAKAPILVRHLLTHTAGFSYTISGNGPLEREYRKRGLLPANGSLGGQPGDAPVLPLQEYVKTLATLPLWQEPGTAWRYSVSLDVAGALLERLTGKTLDVLLREQLFAPLEMGDTGFTVSASNLGRFSSAYAWVNPDMTPIDRPVLVDSPQKTEWAQPPMLLAGGAGLVSTADNYARFAQMLLNDGQFEDRTIMPRGAARHALANLMPKGVFYDGDKGFGAGGSVTLFDPVPGNAQGTPVGTYGWGGAAGTKFFIDPVRQIGVVLMLQFLPSARFPLNEDLARAVNSDLAAERPWSGGRERW